MCPTNVKNTLFSVTIKHAYNSCNRTGIRVQLWILLEELTFLLVLAHVRDLVHYLFSDHLLDQSLSLVRHYVSVLAFALVSITVRARSHSRSRPRPPSHFRFQSPSRLRRRSSVRSLPSSSTLIKLAKAINFPAREKITLLHSSKFH